jgi:hypothetical protein
MRPAHPVRRAGRRSPRVGVRSPLLLLRLLGRGRGRRRRIGGRCLAPRSWCCSRGRRTRALVLLGLAAGHNQKQQCRAQAGCSGSQMLPRGTHWITSCSTSQCRRRLTGAVWMALGALLSTKKMAGAPKRWGDAPADRFRYPALTIRGPTGSGSTPLRPAPTLGLECRHLNQRYDAARVAIRRAPDRLPKPRLRRTIRALCRQPVPPWRWHRSAC